MNTHTIHSLEKVVKALDTIEQALKDIRKARTTLRRSIPRQKQIKGKKR